MQFTVPPSFMEPHLPTFDSNLRATLGKIAHSPISDLAWHQATLPFRLGGLGIRKAHTTAPLAYLASCHSSHSLCRRLLPTPADASFMGEIETSDALSIAYHLPMDSEEANLSQSSLQALVDQMSYDDLLSKCNTRDKARLLAISSAIETSGWLRAVPIPSLGLAMPNPEFIALRTWLGTPIFPNAPSPLCACTLPIDPHGDHLLGCGHGPLRIRRHDMLCDIIWHALSQDNTNSRREQRISGLVLAMSIIWISYVVNLLRCFSPQHLTVKQY